MSPNRVDRKLAAILAADMVGYSRLVHNDEEGTIARLKTHRSELIDPSIARHGGRIVKTMGDGILIEYPSVIDAVLNAVEVQREMAKRNAAVSENQQINFRVGINLGDVVIDGDDILGDGVNVAARLESLAEPGGVCVSGKVHDEVSGKIEFLFEDLGEKRVKNIAEPVRVYRLDVQNNTTKPAEMQTTFDEKPAVAVLPFDNMSGDPEQEYFSDGLSEDIITMLSAWRSFPVIARNSSFVFKGKARDIRQIAADLSARYVIEGSVRKSGNRVRVTAQLIDARTGHHIWAEKYDGSLDDIFEIQDEITRRIVSAVEPQLEDAERTRAKTKRSSNLNAWDCFLRGRALLHKMDPKDNREARKLFERAIELDPGYSDAYADLSYTYQRQILLELPDDRQALANKSLEAAREAVRLESNSSLAHLALGSAYIWLDEHELSIAETRTAVKLNPSNVLAQLALGNRLDIVGASEEGIPLLEKSLELHPRDPHSHVYFSNLARAYVNARDYDKALKCLKEAERRKDDHPHTFHLLAICLGHMGKVDEAKEAAKRCEELHPGFLNKRKEWNIYTDPMANKHLAEGLKKVEFGI